MCKGSIPILTPLDAAQDILQRLTRPMTLLVAVSGGSDSVGLMIALHEALLSDAPPAFRLVAATVDHQLRAGSADEAHWVAGLCAELGISHHILRWDGPKPSTGIPAAAREARYRLLCQAAELSGAGAILTGHTFDDQIETVAMRSAREGEGDSLGSAGMADATLVLRRHWLLRPFLRSRREDIRQYLRERGRGWVEDPSNANEQYERVRVRKGIRDSAGIEPSDILCAAERRGALGDAAAALARVHVTVEHGVLAEIARPALAEDARALRHLIAHLMAILGGRQHLPSTATMARIATFVEAGSPGRMTAGRVILDLRQDYLFLHREVRSLPVLQIAPGKSSDWDERFRFSNLTDGVIRLSPTPPNRVAARDFFPSAPPAVALRAMQVMPHVEGVRPEDEPGFMVEQVLAPYDRFLPQFELSLAKQLGILFGCDRFPAMPVKLSGWKS